MKHLTRAGWLARHSRCFLLFSMQQQRVFILFLVAVTSVAVITLTSAVYKGGGLAGTDNTASQLEAALRKIRREAVEEEVGRLKLRLQQAEHDNTRLTQQTAPVKTRSQAFLRKVQQHLDYSRAVMNGSIPVALAKFVHCQAHNGIGNTMQIAASCFLYALATQRVFLLSMFIALPIAKMIVPPDPNFLNTDFVKGLKSTEIVATELPCQYFEDTDHVQILKGAHSYDYFATGFIQNSPHMRALRESLPVNWIQIVSGQLFQLLPHLRARVDEFKTRHFAAYNVGIQVRFPVNKTVPGEWYKGKADHEGHPVPPLALYAQAAELLSYQQEVVSPGSVKYFVASQLTCLQQPLVVEQLKALLGQDRVVHYTGKITTSYDPDPEGAQTAFLTWWLLGECDEVVCTECSSYGVNAAARGGKQAIVCNHGRFCMRRITAEPCMTVGYAERDEYPVKPVNCLKHQRERYYSVDSSCGYFTSVIRASPHYEKGEQW